MELDSPPTCKIISPGISNVSIDIISDDKTERPTRRRVKKIK
jgi:hypothetical protein